MSISSGVEFCSIGNVGIRAAAGQISHQMRLFGTASTNSTNHRPRLTLNFWGVSSHTNGQQTATQEYVHIYNVPGRCGRQRCQGAQGVCPHPHSVNNALLVCFSAASPDRQSSSQTVIKRWLKGLLVYYTHSAKSAGSKSSPASFPTSPIYYNLSSCDLPLTTPCKTLWKKQWKGVGTFGTLFCYG